MEAELDASANPVDLFSLTDERRVGALATLYDIRLSRVTLNNVLLHQLVVVK